MLAQLRGLLAAPCWLVAPAVALLAVACSRPSGEPQPRVQPTMSALVPSGSSTPSASSAALTAPQRRPLKLELRADDLPPGGQRIVARVPELGIEEVVAEAVAPFVCQTTLRPMGGEPRMTGGSNRLDIWCGSMLLASITRDEGTLKLGEKQFSLPPGRFISLREVPQLQLKERSCDASAESVEVRLVVRGNELKVEVPKLGLSLRLQEVPRGSGLRCQTTVDQAALRMGVSCSKDPQPYPVPNPELQVISGVLIVEQTWQHYERSGHSRWGIRLPCGQVQLKGVDYRDARYGVRTCTEKCLDRVSACQSKCKPSDAEDNPCADSCYEMEGRCLRSCGD